MEFMPLCRHKIFKNSYNQHLRQLILMSMNITHTFLFTRLSLGADNGGKVLILYSITVSYRRPYVILQFYWKTKTLLNCGIPHET
jgi:hypothetical protein